MLLNLLSFLSLVFILFVIAIVIVMIVILCVTIEENLDEICEFKYKFGVYFNIVKFNRLFCYFRDGKIQREKFEKFNDFILFAMPAFIIHFFVFGKSFEEVRYLRKQRAERKRRKMNVKKYKLKRKIDKELEKKNVKISNGN